MANMTEFVWVVMDNSDSPECLLEVFDNADSAFEYFEKLCKEETEMDDKDIEHYANIWIKKFKVRS
jgi:hypothetical protein